MLSDTILLPVLYFKFDIEGDTPGESETKPSECEIFLRSPKTDLYKKILLIIHFEINNRNGIISINRT